MKKNIFYILVIVLLTSCELISPGDVVNPNVTQDKYLNTYKSMKSWRLGLEREMAITTGVFVELTEIISDNYFNNYTLSSKVFDFPVLDYQDVDVTRMQRLCAKLRESAIFGIDQIESADESTTNEDRYWLYLIKGYSYLLAGENFTGLPLVAGGEVKDWKENLKSAITDFSKALTYATDSKDVAVAKILITRAYYRLGDKTNAVKFANESLSQHNDIVKGVTFDGTNGLNNPAQTYIYGFAFQPLPRLDFLDPKYFQLYSTEQRSIIFAKSEESYLVLAEAMIVDNRLDEARSILKSLHNLVKNRPLATVNDQIEKRGAGYTVRYPDNSLYSVAASPGEEFKAGLILDRKAPNFVQIPYISGTSVSIEQINAASSVDSLLELLYLMRQEIFFAEGRRVADLGIRLPVAYAEYTTNKSAEPFINAQIPSFIPRNQEMDSFILDATNLKVTIKHNMNKVIVQNKNSKYVVPFIN